MTEPVLDQAFECDALTAGDMDRLWAAGWRHFGAYFFRYNLQPAGDDAWLHVTPLRMELGRFVLSRSQRRVLRRNEDLRCEFRPAALSDEAAGMFERHKGRFKDNVPEALETFLGWEPGTVPCECVECRVWDGDKLVAISFLDVGARATSAVYGLFEPEHSWRSLGIYTMLKEIEYSGARGCMWYYPGYATREPSAYDYKKQLGALEFLDWETGEWWPQGRTQGERLT